jgi:hypothetical protein
LYDARGVVLGDGERKRDRREYEGDAGKRGAKEVGPRTAEGGTV